MNVKYLVPSDFQHIVVFIYDDSQSVQEHADTSRDLRKVPGVFDVVIASKPKFE